MITPQTHPSYFREEAAGPFTYDVFVYHSIGLDEDVQSAIRRYWRNAYKAAMPDELKDGKIVEDKYVAWANGDTDEDSQLNRGAMKAVAKILFVPKNGAPAPDSDEFWYLISSEQYANVRSFTKPTSSNNTEGLATSAMNTNDSPVSVTA